MFSYFFKNAADTTEEKDEKPLECNYDTDLITLYQALEEQAWIPALDLIEADSQESRDQVRTWVTRYEKNGSVRWSQLPIHAAMIFKAPFKIVKALVDAYPAGVRCTDDAHNLPLHLAFRYDSPDNILLFLLEAFPEAMNAKNNKGRVPAICACPESPYRSKIVRYHIDNTKQLLLEDRPMDKQVAELEAKLEEQTKQTEELEAEKEAWTAREAELKKEISRLEEKLAKELKQGISVLEDKWVTKKEAVAKELEQEISDLEDKLATKKETVAKELEQEISDLEDKLATKKEAIEKQINEDEKVAAELKQEISKLEDELVAKKEAVKKQTGQEMIAIETTLTSVMDTDKTSVKSTKSSRSTKSSNSNRSLGKKILSFRRKSKSKEAEVNPAGE